MRAEGDKGKMGMRNPKGALGFVLLNKSPAQTNPGFFQPDLFVSQRGNLVFNKSPINLIDIRAFSNRIS